MAKRAIRQQPQADLFDDRKTTTYTVIYGTLDRLPMDGPGVYNRDPDPECEHPLGMRWVIWPNDQSLNEDGSIAVPTQFICLCCGCGLPPVSGSFPVVLPRNECERLMRADFMSKLQSGKMGPGTVHRTLVYLFGWKRAFPAPATYYRGRSCPDRRVAKFRLTGGWRSTSLQTARRMVAEGKIRSYPTNEARRTTAIVGLTLAVTGRRQKFPARWPTWIWPAAYIAYAPGA